MRLLLPAVPVVHKVARIRASADKAAPLKVVAPVDLVAVNDARKWIVN
jgi:hypothetical protein